MWRPLLATCLACVASFAAADPAVGPAGRPLAFVGGTVIPVSSPPIERGTVVVAGGRIAAVGPAATTAVPPDAEIVDATGKVVMPGLVDTHSHVGGGRGGDSSAAVQPDVRILDSINVRERASHGIGRRSLGAGDAHLARPEPPDERRVTVADAALPVEERQRDELRPGVEHRRFGGRDHAADAVVGLRFSHRAVLGGGARRSGGGGGIRPWRPSSGPVPRPARSARRT